METNPLILDAQTLKRLPVPNTAVAQMPSANPLPGPLPMPTVVSPIQAAQNLQRLPVPAASTLPPMTTGTPDVPAPPMPTAMLDPAIQNTRSRLLGDQAEYQRKLSTGSGISQIKNPLLRGIARFGETAESIVAPRAAQYTPGTELHHQMELSQDAGRINNDLSNQQEQAHTAEIGAQTEQREALAQMDQARANNYLHPKTGSILYDKNGTAIGYQDQMGKYYGPNDPNLDPGVREVLSAAARKQPTNPFELWQAQNPKGSAEDYLKLIGEGKIKPLSQQLLEAELAGDEHTAASIRRVINETQVQPKIDVHAASAPATGTWTPGFDADKNPVMFNNKTGEVKPMAGSFKKDTATNAKISSDEQKRADLAQNMNENIDQLEDILNRRPDLFGPVAGRMTQAKVALGTDDQDAAKLFTLEHQLGMVAQGAHGMRSAQGVESAAKSLTNGFKNSPEATRAALESARTSVATFLRDSQAPGQARGNITSPPAGSSGRGVKLSDAMALPQNKGKSADEVARDIEAHGHAVIR